jgi:hypothetical protein
MGTRRRPDFDIPSGRLRIHVTVDAVLPPPRQRPPRSAIALALLHALPQWALGALAVLIAIGAVAVGVLHAAA